MEADKAQEQKNSDVFDMNGFVLSIQSDSILYIIGISQNTNYYNINTEAKLQVATFAPTEY